MPSPEKFKASLIEHQVGQEVIDRINKGYEKVVDRSPKKVRSAYFKQAMDVLDEMLPREVVLTLLEENACCKSGAREKRSKEFARINGSLSINERLEKINEAPYMNMGFAEIDEKGDLIVHGVSYEYEGRYECGCSIHSRVKRDYAVSRSYCYCCGGHFKFHYEIMLGVKLKLIEVIASPLDTAGKEPCIFRFQICK